MNLLNYIYKKLFTKIDIPFLLFLIAISSNKIYLKVFALILIFVLKPKFDFWFNKKLSFFYPFLIILSFTQFIFFGHDYSLNHIVTFSTGIFYWLICYAFMYQSFLFVKENSVQKIDATIVTYVLVNLSVCLFNYFYICSETGTIFPFFLGEGDYGSSTGDHLTGLFGRPSYVNAMINFLLALHFLNNKKTGWFLLTTFCAVLSFANIVNLIFLGILLLSLIFAGDKKRLLVICAGIAMCFLMYYFISPENYNYVGKTLGLSVNNQREIMPEVIFNSQGKHARKNQRVKYVNDSSAADQKIFMSDRSLLFNQSFNEYKTYYPVDVSLSPGKKVAVLQTFQFLKNNPDAAIFGAGCGNFSSRLAFQFSGRDSSRLFRKLPNYCSGYYFKNNLLIYDIIESLPTEYHSIKHFPNNFLSQLIGEYGLIGLLLFIYFYFYYYYKLNTNKVFFFLFFFTISGFLMLDYLFEFFNVMVFFELVMFINIKHQQQEKLSHTLFSDE